MNSETGVAWGEVLDRLRSSVAGEFEILREIGSGRIAAVFLAREIALSRQVAIKVMSPWLLTDADRVEHFRNQAVTVAALDHPNIVPVYAVRHENDLHFFVEKFIRGRSLAQAIRTSGPLPIPLVRGLLYMIGDALAHAHRHDVVHGGINPANVLIDGTGEAIVKDFGMERGPWGGDESWIGWQSGTATYSSPEQCLSQPVTDASDQYSLGVVAYEMLTGRPPFTGSQFQLMQAHTASPIPVIAEYRPDSPPDLSDAVARMLSKDPADRWPSIQHAMAETGAAPLPGGSPTRLALAKLGIPERDLSTVGRTSGAVAAPEQRVQGPPSEVSSVAILSPPVSIEVGDELTLRATARKWSGENVPSAGIRWQTDNPTVVAIDEVTGLIRAFSPGCAVITARIDTVRAAVALVVTPARVAELSVLDPPGVVHVGHRLMLSAIPRDRLGNALSSRPVLWTSADSDVATVTTSGIATARGYGAVELTCTCEGHTASIELRVAKPEAVVERPAFVPVAPPPMPLVGFAQPDEEEEDPELITSVPILVPTTPLSETEEEGVERFTDLKRVLAVQLRQGRVWIAFGGGVILAFVVAVIAMRPHAGSPSSDPGRTAASDSARSGSGVRSSPDEGTAAGSTPPTLPVSSPKADPARPRTTLNGSVSTARPPDPPPPTVKPLKLGAGVASLGEKAQLPSLTYDSNLHVTVPNPSANLPAITTSGTSRGPSARTFADSAANVLQRFADAIRQRDISSIRGKLQQGLADQLERGVNSTREPIAVHLVGVSYDALTAKAFFRLQVQDSANQTLVPAADLEVTFQRVPGGLRIATVDPRR